MTEVPPPAQCLVGSPYLLPEDDVATAQLAVLLERENRVKERLREARAELRKMQLLSATNRYQRTREIYESNAIEGVGPDLATTWRVLESGPARDMEDQFDTHLLALSLDNDPDISAVLGLHGARLLARRLQDDQQRPWSEADLRSLHATICAGESFAGMYKRFHVRIGGEASHEPHLPIDVSAAMHQLTDWWAGAIEGPAVIRAAAAHAWLTHIHPFEDGNGRLARLMANVTLTRCELAPAIVKHNSQRAAYLDALRHSDDGGDILPLANLFLQIVMRHAIDISKPRRLREIFFQEVQRREEGYYALWQTALEEFMSELFASLRLQGFRIVRHGDLDYDSFRFLQDLDPSGNSWYASVIDSDQREVLFWFGYPSINMRRPDEKVPAIFLSVPDDRPWALRPYRPPTVVEAGGLTELMVTPGATTNVYAIRGGRMRFGRVPDSSDEIADTLASAFRKGLVPRKSRRTSVVGG